MSVMIEVSGLAKTFVLHLQGGARLPALTGVDLAVRAGECLALSGPSGSGKSTLLRSLYGNYAPTAGSIRVNHNGAMTEIAGASSRLVQAVRARTVGYVSQFLRVIPRVPAVDVVAAGLNGPCSDIAKDEARRQATALLDRLNLPRALHGLSPTTFSGGEQQRVNIARGFIRPMPILLLDEPTASLDAANRDVVVALIQEAKARGAAVVGIFHDLDARDRVADRILELKPCEQALAEAS